MILFNDLTERVVMREGRKQSISIAQVKEVTRILLQELATEDPKDILRLIKRYYKR